MLNATAAKSAVSVLARTLAKVSSVVNAARLTAMYAANSKYIRGTVTAGGSGTR